MEFRLPVPRIKSSFEVSHRDKLLVLGSCFTENIGNLLESSGFQTLINPYGIIYNPASIFKGISEIQQQKQYVKDDLEKVSELYFSYNHHGSFSDIDENTCLEKINKNIVDAHHFQKETSVVFITLGTAFVYELKDSGRIVANCHKLPSASFTKRLLKKEEIVYAFDEIQLFFPSNSKIIFTVSPVRHWKDGAAENSLSKAVLLTVIHEIVAKYPNCSYFPAYELLIDDLRDYRFYAGDMLHPNQLAVNYIWERFRETYFSDKTNSIIDELNALRQSLEHRAIFPGTNSHKNFLSDLEKKKTAFLEKYPFIKL